MADDDRQQKPSMDEILSSIRHVDSPVEGGPKNKGEPKENDTGAEGQEEPSMDEILSSIRRVVSSGEEEARTRVKAEAEEVVPRNLDSDAGAPEEGREPSTDEILSSIRQVVSAGEESDKKADAAAANFPAKTDADTSLSEKQQVPSMDEILSSIRRVVSSEEDEKTKNEMDIAPGQSEANRDSFITGDDDSISAPSLQNQDGSLDISEMTVRELGAQLMRPVMLEWLNQHLPPMVEQIVRAEFERLKKETK